MAKNKTKAKAELKHIPIQEIGEINILFEWQGKQYMLLPKSGSKTDAKVSAITALRLALDTHKVAEIIDPDIEKLKDTLNEVIK